VQAAVAPDARPENLRQPGHIFPLMSQPGGVVTRAGHTEAGCDLARLAGVAPASVIVEILNEDGTMARRPQLETFARRHKLRIGTIADLIRYRLEKEETVERISEHEVQTECGDFRMVCFEDHVNRNVHIALVRGEIDPEQPVLVRVHVTDTLGDILGVQNPQLGWPLRDAMRRIASEPSGVLVVLRNPESPRELMDMVNALDASRPNEGDGRRDHGQVLRTYGTGAQILRNLGIRKMRVMSAPKQMLGISGFGLEVVDYVYPE
jgi:3,4-dihydroxy 2-butanone 4-phosphate synthase/GTP cyclohydrolase II